MPDLICPLLGLLIVILGIVFAIYGFVVFLNRAFLVKHRPSEKRNLAEDVVGTCYLLNHLVAQGEISKEDYFRLRRFLEEKFGHLVTLPGPLTTHPQLAPRGTPQPVAPPVQRPPTSVVARSADTAPPPTKSSTQPVPDLVEADADVAEPHVTAEIANPVDQVAPVGPPSPSPTPAPSVPVATTATPREPWDVPDEPVRPRRSWAEFFSVFMQEKNIRWGELASGLLIVGSAVGLVVSLRHELNRTIPYFPALLFLLITAAIHGAGAYTLKKWKLQKTSRGTLLIGLFLVPLNFLAACLLRSGQSTEEALTSPTYWIAVTIGLLSYGAMVWFSSRLLLRRGSLPLWVGMMGSAVTMLVVNRVDLSGATALWWMALGVPLGLLATVGSLIWWPRVSRRRQWTERTFNRVAISFGLTLFSVASVVALAIVRAPDRELGATALTPLAVWVGVLLVWVGAMAERGLFRAQHATLRVVARAIFVLGWIVVGGGLLASFAMPVVTLVAALLVAAGCVMVARELRKPSVLAVAWCGLGLAISVGINLWMQVLPWQGWGSLDAWRAGLFSGQTGIALMATAGLAAALTRWTGLSRWAAGGDARETTEAPFDSLTAWLPIGVLAGAGCAVSLVGGFLHRDNVFDTSTASVLMALGWIGASIASIRVEHRAVVNVAAWTGYLFGAFTCFWNPVTARWIESHVPAMGGNALVLFAVHALGCGLTAAALRGANAHRRINDLSVYTLISTGFATVVAFAVAGMGTGFAAGMMVLVAAGSLGLARGTAQGRGHVDGGAIFKTVVVLAGIVALIDHAHRLGIPEWQSPAHWLVQAIALAGWFLVAVLLEWRYCREEGPGLWWLGRHVGRWNTVALWAGLIGGLGLVGMGLVDAILRQLISGFEGLAWSPRPWQGLSLGAVFGWLVAAYRADRIRSTPSRRAALAVAWTFAWSVGALWADAGRATATALRWSLSIGAVVTASAAWLNRSLNWSRAEQEFQDMERAVNETAESVSEADVANALASRTEVRRIGIDTFLSGVVAVMLTVTTATIARVMLAADAAQALGGPLPGSWWLQFPVEVSYGVPVGLLTVALLIFAISERRPVLAMAGSSLYQYAVLLVLVLLVWSPHPQLATRWFLNIVQAVSIGMSLYGFGWYAARRRIQQVESGRMGQRAYFDWHVTFNAILVTGVAALVGARYFLHPAVGGGWVTAAGDLAGFIGIAMVVGLMYVNLRDRFLPSDQRHVWTALTAWGGLVATFLAAAWFDQYRGGNWEQAVTVIAWGGVVVSSAVCAMLVGWQIVSPESEAEPHRSALVSRRLGRTVLVSLPIWFSTLIPLLFAWLGAEHFSTNPSFMSSAFALAIATTIGGIAANRVSTAYAAAIAVACAASMLFRVYPSLWTGARLPGVIHVAMAGWGLIAIAWVVADVWLDRADRRLWYKMLFVNLVMGGTGAWAAIGALGQYVVFMESNLLGGAQFVFNVWGAVFWGASLALQFAVLWHPCVRVRVVSRFLLTQAALVLAAVAMMALYEETNSIENALSFLWILFAWSANVGLWGGLWLVRRVWVDWLRRLKVADIDGWLRSLKLQLPILGLLTAVPVVWFALLVLGSLGDPFSRYLAAMLPAMIVFGLAGLAGSLGHRWLQWVSLALATLTGMMLAWADLPPIDAGQDLARWWLRAELVLAGAMFLFGAAVPRLVRASDPWLKSLREATVVVCGLAFVGMVGLVVSEFMRFDPESGSGVLIYEAIAVVGVGIGMVAGLILIAIRPRLDPFSLSDRLRTGYVYVAQAMVVLVVMHAYLSMPWIFQLGIMKYWPYLMMAVAFGGIGLAEVLKRRELTVLADPIFNTAAALPVLISGAIWSIDSAADTSLVLLVGGLAYLLISHVRHSITSGLLSIVLGNLALWVFYNRYPGLAFFEHPQLWLIPPALSLLVAGHLNRSRLAPSQLAMLRYVCVGAIYLSSTAEIFIRGIGQALWPPMVLAVLAVAGMFAGMLFHVRAYLYFGALFLLMAMIAMVSHAQQRLGHVWPWWAFGIALGTAILVMFGLFEKRRNKLKNIADELRRWDL